MKKVNIYIIVDFREGRSSPWEALLRCGKASKSVTGKHKARSEGGIKAYALKMALESLTSDCHVDVYALPQGLKSLVFDEGRPDMLTECMNQVSQFIWLREGDLPAYLDPVVERVRKS